ncbi:amidohydrolase [Candidatus Bathyarchaeota archaeon]|jgi:imidazolonepropionase-like amidohydrolase|nr:amidohydrolase [Candidatus Bathyarchaeota archaeon]MBT4319872.1 amidohydrolase [Candidatus Bathyarchaeota archaeon]MBT4423972.1 amidohydrolase [Candidatus Bathyarchaeota archaeon]MBT5642010.1 amidohydrolase [Candidatus Bathyarchaeota archaeon]MBT7186507.1 amidohydrolase [Candidatus Bathyarchaeota archaeon]
MLAIIGKKVNTITNGIIKNGVILVEDGKVKAIGPDVKIPDDIKPLKAKYVMPGLVEAHCHIGIWEEKIGWAGSDGNEMTEAATPHVRALDGIKANANESGLEAALHEGITTAQVLPGSANVIGGFGVVLKTTPKTTVDQMVIRNPSGMKIAFGENPMRAYGVQKKVMPSTRMGVAGVLRESLQKTKNYMEKMELYADDPEKKPEVDLRLEALIPVLKKEIPFRAHAHRADDVATAIRICEEFDVEMSWEHATEGHRIAEYIAEKKVSAVWGPSLTSRPKWEMRELGYSTPKIMFDAGVKFAIQTDAVGSTIRFLPICAALSVREGLPYDYALKAITIIPAEIIGVSDRVGSLEVGKDADLRLLSGDPLEFMTRCQKVIIDGEVVYSLK